MLTARISTDWEEIKRECKRLYAKIDEGARGESTEYGVADWERCKLWVDLYSMKKSLIAVGIEVATSTHPIPRIITLVTQYFGH